MMHNRIVEARRALADKLRRAATWVDPDYNAIGYMSQTFTVPVISVNQEAIDDLFGRDEQ